VKVAVLLVLLVSPAHADHDALHARVEAETGKTWLEIDPVFAPQVEGLAVTERVVIRDTTRIDSKSFLVLELDQWSTMDSALPSVDARAQGWKASVVLTRQIGGLTFAVRGVLGDVDAQFAGRGRYYDVGASVMKVIKRKHGKKAWFGLSFGRRRWLGKDDAPPPGAEQDGEQLMLVVGWTF
jgi:hypothetical protein